MGRKRSANVEEKRKAVKVRPIERKHKGKPTEPYRIMAEVIKAHHTGKVKGSDGKEVFRNLENARIVLLWRRGIKPDVDKVIVLAKIKKTNEVDHATAAALAGGVDDFDFVMQLNEEAWSGLSDDKKRHVIDHELTHAAPDLDRDGKQKLDSKERLCWRTRKHPIQEFPEIIERYGVEECLGLNAVAQKAVEDADRPLLAEAEKTGATAGATAGATTEATAKATTTAEPVAAPKRVRLTRACKGLGKAGTEWDVVKCEPDGQIGVPGPSGEVVWLRLHDCEPVGQKQAVASKVTDWRKQPINALELTENILAKCGEKDVLRLGDFQKFQAKHGDFWAKELGLHGSQAGTVMDAWERFWKEHPEFCQEPKPVV